MLDLLVAQVSDTQLFLFGVAILAVFILLMLGTYLNWLFQQELNGNSPYSGRPLMSGTRLPYISAKKVERYLKSLHQYENRPFNMNAAAVCKETGRIFPHSRKWPWRYEVDWGFLQRTYPGHYVSWGSLTVEQKRAITEAHDGKLGGYETSFSSPEPLPKDIDKMFALHEHGPLYVDIETKVLLGWKNVPNTDLEVLIVQKPVRIVTVTVPKEKKADSLKEKK